MKKILSILLAAAMLTALFAVTPVAAKTAKSGAFTYEIVNGGAEITKYSGKASKLTIPSKLGGYPVRTIGRLAFWKNKYLKSVVVPKTVETIIGDSFCECTSLKSISLPDTLKELDYAFTATAWLKSQPNGPVYIGKYFYQYKGYCPAEVKIKEGTLGIAGASFEYCVGLKKVVIPSSVRFISTGAFYHCPSMLSVTVPRSVKRIDPFALGGLCEYESETAKYYTSHFTIKGYRGTAAEKYIKNGFVHVKFVDLAGKLATPALGIVENTKDGILLGWRQVKGADKYRIFRKTGSGKWTKLADTTKRGYLDKTAKKGVTYSYTLRCVSAIGFIYTSDYDTKGTTIKCKR